MQEQQRLDYLQAMGIQVWMPRKVIDNAADSLWLAKESAASSDDLAQPPSQSSPQFNNLSSLGAGLLSDGDSQKSSETSASETNEAQTHVASSAQQALSSSEVQKLTTADAKLKSEGSELNNLELNNSELDSSKLNESKHSDLEPKVIPKFMLEFSLWSGGILWVSSAKQSDPLLALQNKIGFAFNSEIQQLNQLTFKWPFLEHGREDQSEVVAIRALTAQWQFIQQQNISCCVALDEEAEYWLKKIDAKVLTRFSADELFTSQGKQQLWKLLSGLKVISN